MFHLHPVTESDLPLVNDLWYAAFEPSGFLSLIPDTPGVRSWWTSANSQNIRNCPAVHYLQIVDDENPPEKGGPVVAYAKWCLETAEERGARFPPWHKDMDRVACSEVFGRMERQRAAVVGGRKNYYLDMLCTHPSYRGRGAASRLMKWGVERADRDGVPVYIDASTEGKPVYERYGFEDRTVPEFAVKGVYSMVREPKL